MRKLLRVLRWLLDQVMAAFLVIAILGAAWAVILHRHLLPVAYGITGTYAEVSLPETLTLNTRVDEFTATPVPGHIVQIAGVPIAPIPDMLVIWVRYNDEHGIEREWEGSYFIACDEDGDCIPVSALNGVRLSGQAHGGYGTERLRWVPLKSPMMLTRPPKDKKADPPKPVPTSVSPPRQPA